MQSEGCHDHNELNLQCEMQREETRGVSTFSDTSAAATYCDANDGCVLARPRPEQVPCRPGGKRLASAGTAAETLRNGAAHKHKRHDFCPEQRLRNSDLGWKSIKSQMSIETITTSSFLFGHKLNIKSFLGGVFQELLHEEFKINKTKHFRTIDVH